MELELWSLRMDGLCLVWMTGLLRMMGLGCCRLSRGVRRAVVVGRMLRSWMVRRWVVRSYRQEVCLVCLRLWAPGMDSRLVVIL